MNAPLAGRWRFLLLLAAAVAAGTGLRLRMLPGQLLLDDEWHGLNQVAGSTFAEVLTRFDAKDNTSLPLNLYDWALLHTVGWSELAVRLPVLLAGIACLFVLPLAARRFTGDRTALFFAFLLAASPFAIFYSRFSRAYGIVLLLGFLAILAACRWLATGGRREGRLFTLFGVLGAYAHPLAAIPLTVPFVLHGYALLRRGRSGRGAAEAPGVTAALSSGDLRKGGGRILLLLAPLAWAVVTATERLPWGRGDWSVAGFRDAATLLSGTVNVPLTIVFFAAAIAGLASLSKRDPIVARAIVATAVIYLAMLAVTRPFGIGTGVVVLRYMIVVVPLAFLAVAAGFDAIGPPKLRAAVFAIFLLLVVWTGPLASIYAPPNNFTNHSTFQGSYDPPVDSVSDARHVYPGYRLTRADVPAFYREVATAPGAATIIEYPFDVTNYNDILWFYQRVHGKEVLAGFCPDGSILGYTTRPEDEESGEEATGGAPPRLGMLSADQILSHVADRSKLRFRNMVDVTDTAAVARSGASYLVVHKYVMALRFLPGGASGVVPVYYKSAPAIAARYAGTYGPPVWEDGSMVCFRIGKP